MNSFHFTQQDTFSAREINIWLLICKYNLNILIILQYVPINPIFLHLKDIEILGCALWCSKLGCSSPPSLLSSATQGVCGGVLYVPGPGEFHGCGDRGCGTYSTEWGRMIQQGVVIHGQWIDVPLDWNAGCWGGCGWWPRTGKCRLRRALLCQRSWKRLWQIHQHLHPHSAENAN